MKLNFLSMVVAVMVVLSRGALAVPVLGQLWDVADPTVWTVQVVDGSLPAAPSSPVASVTPSGTSVVLDFRAAGVDSPWAPTAAFSTTSKAGDWSTLIPGGRSLEIHFTLNNVDDTTPVFEGLSLYYVSGGATNYSVALTAPALAASQSYTIPLLQASWLSDPIGMLNIDEFGFILSEGPGTGSRQYEFSDVFVELNVVPEPETVWMVLMVLASLGITFRGRLLELGKLALASVRK